MEQVFSRGRNKEHRQITDGDLATEMTVYLLAL